MELGLCSIEKIHVIITTMGRGEIESKMLAVFWSSTVLSHFRDSVVTSVEAFSCSMLRLAQGTPHDNIRYCSLGTFCYSVLNPYFGIGAYISLSLVGLFFQSMVLRIERMRSQCKGKMGLNYSMRNHRQHYRVIQALRLVFSVMHWYGQWWGVEGVNELTELQ